MSQSPIINIIYNRLITHINKPFITEKDDREIVLLCMAGNLIEGENFCLRAMNMIPDMNNIRQQFMTEQFLDFLLAGLHHLDQGFISETELIQAFGKHFDYESVYNHFEFDKIS